MWYWITKWIHWWVNYFHPPPLLPPYENSYNLSSTATETPENLKRRQVQEVTPEGLVTLTYDTDSSAFFYWSEKVVAYKYLEVVARKYVIVYDCRDIYINMFRELLKTFQKKRRMVNERGNTYKYKGKSCEEEVKPVYKPITYLDYKKNNCTL